MLPRAAGRGQGDRNRRHPRSRRLHPRFRDGLGVQPGQVFGQGGAQRRQTAHIGIPCLPRRKRCHGSLMRNARARLIRLAEAQEIHIRRGESDPGHLDDARAGNFHDIHDAHVVVRRFGVESPTFAGRGPQRRKRRRYMT